MKNKIVKTLIYFFTACILTILLFFAYGYRFYRSVFRLSYEQIAISLLNTTPQCTTIKDCSLKPGDILIRRYVTNTSEVFSAYLNPYFTHSAVYLGNNELFEALGNDQTPENQIKITNLTKGDWVNGNLEAFVVIRPKKIAGNFEKIGASLRKMANDPQYTFGPWNEEQKQASCSDSIYETLVKNSIIKVQNNPPRYITPDFLFWTLKNDQENFEIVGYNVKPKI